MADVNLEQLQAQTAAMVILQMEKQQEAEKDAAFELARKMRIDQERNKFKSPADKRAVGFILDLQFDMADFFKSFSKLLEGEELKNIPNNVAVFEAFLKSCPGFVNKMNRKLEREYEAYNVANTSCFGWSTEKYYRSEDLFNKSGVLDQTKWFEKDEISAEDKVKKYRNAERQAALSRKNRKPVFSSKFENRGNKRSRWGFPASESASSSSAPATAVSSDFKFGPQQLYQPPVRPPPTCFSCGQVGHIQRFCPSKQMKKD